MSSLPVSPSPITLNHLRVGDAAIVTDLFQPAQSNLIQATDIIRRLKELGFIHGEKIKILHKGYFGGEPIAVRVGESTFALRNFEAALIGVSKTEAA
ncbi:MULTISPECIES: FeoA family protein [Undibacterium]|jgi:ferrous iron transport protein A|uniref:Ferrous iron transport protein A n=1 Tax=Undibacterium aquatile TaxID=1537398 RepID=A0ABR6XDN7_9BURK|nr:MULTISPECIES: FeoA family protein [Undibacterium]MBC3811025.1 ferrous iron transport protein A [Undibacterium aquatile]MBC3876824.1 ferrous iron transport protein A [Undibacterium sp. FT79W]MBY0569721.1 ferrous iron transport protein A [Burkholderiaceae bacterium]